MNCKILIQNCQEVITGIESILPNPEVMKLGRTERILKGIKVFSYLCPFQDLSYMFLNNKTFPNKELKTNRESLELRLRFWKCLKHKLERISSESITLDYFNYLVNKTDIEVYNVYYKFKEMAL